MALLITVVNSAFSQIQKKIIGNWQAESGTITSMYHDTYQFFNGGGFTFKPDAYNGLNRIISIRGTYKIKGDTLILEPKYTEEIVGGFPIRSESTLLSDTWEIVQGKTKIIPCKTTKQMAVIKFNSDSKFITLDSRKFYKI